jgi:hypothetical protein
VPATSVADRLDVVEVVNREPDHRPITPSNGIRKIIRENGLARTVRAIDTHEHAPAPRDVLHARRDPVDDH